MAMAEGSPMGSKKDIIASLKQRACELWGEERTLAIESTIEQTADHIWRVSQDPPADDEEPAFYL